MITTTVRLQLECDQGPSICLRQPTIITGASESECRNKARADGWLIGADRTCLCPPHAAAQQAAARSHERVLSESTPGYQGYNGYHVRGIHGE